MTLAVLEAHPHGIDLGALTPRLPEVLRTASGAIELAPEPLVADVERLRAALDRRAADGSFVLVGRRHLRSNNSWMHNARSLVKGPDRARLLVHPRDAERLGLASGQKVRVRSRTGAVATEVELSDAMMEGVVSLPHGYGHEVAKDTLRVAGALAAPSANSLTDELFIEPLCGTSILNGVPVTIEAVAAGSAP
jgi:anaerobic selenocysteine-containing dehydrogenase